MRNPCDWRSVAAFLILALSMGTNARAESEDQARVPYTEMRVVQGVGLDVVTRLASGTSPRFKQGLPPVCSPTGQITALAPILSALSGIVVDWLFGRAIDSLDRRLQERIRAHTATYAHEPLYGIMTASRWKDGQSCVVVQRIECTVTPEAAEQPDTRCGEDGELQMSVALLLRNERSHFLALPAAVELTRMKPLHAGGKASAAVSLRLDALSFDAQAGGGTWTSGDTVMLAEAFPADAARRGGKAQPDFFRKYDTDETAWEKPIRLPMVPTLPNDPDGVASAIVVTVAEVGATPRGLKDFAAFIAAKKDDLAGALSAAVKKKLSVGE